jgi:hypothetical protein
VASRTAERKFAAEFAGYVLSDDKYFGIAAEFAGYVLSDDKWTFFKKK